MKQNIILILLCCSVLTLFAQTKTITTGLQHPESIISDGEFFYATNIGEALSPMTKDGDGSIYKLSLDGKLIEQRFNKSPLNAPKGTAIVNGVLYVADIDRVVGVDIRTGEQVKEIDLAAFGTSFLNDISVKDETTLFVV
jgi:outer membrane protein assembly factor BamB